MTAAVGAPATQFRRAGWAIALRGIVAVIFGILALRYPSAAAGAFVVIFAVFAFADAIFDIVAATSMGRMGMRWGWYAFAALISIAAGVIALAYPQITFMTLVLLVGIRAVVLGMLEIGVAFSWKELDSRWLVGLTGVLSILLGVLLFASPSRGGLALLWTIGVYAIVVGVVLIGVGIKVGATRHQLMSGHAAAA
jgi:uncharacterized membrane protein HdeD (DUF308 family)